ncbi:hypothetical protein H671_4g13121, partial [Cricetulus griseus]
ETKEIVVQRVRWDRKAIRAKKALLVLKAHQAFQESQEKKANRAEMENQVPLENRVRQEIQAYQEQREPEVLRENLGLLDPLEGKDHQEKMVTLDLQDFRVPEDQGAHRAQRETKEKMEAQDFQVFWVPVGLRVLLGSLESQDPKEKG